MDDDDYRRGRPASHRVFGEANAILAGDALLTLAFNILAGTPEKEAALRAVEVLSRAAGTEGLIGGQVLDLAFQGKKKSGKVARYVDSHKTGALFGASTAIGAIVARAGAREEKALAEFGRLLGISFQLIDDMIDAEGAGRVFEKRARKKAGDCMRRAKGCLRVLGGGAERLAQIGDSLLQRVD
jgi:geranylgeranyl diphosphate synthase type II